MEKSSREAPGDYSVPAIEAEPSKLLYSVRQLQHELGIGRSQIYRLIDSGQLIPRKLGYKTVFLGKDIRRLVASLPKGGV
jgi:predicted DNA-binding transcriptional regulator AlpA